MPLYLHSSCKGPGFPTGVHLSTINPTQNQSTHCSLPGNYHKTITYQYPTHQHGPSSAGTDNLVPAERDTPSWQQNAEGKQKLHRAYILPPCISPPSPPPPPKKNQNLKTTCL